MTDTAVQDHTQALEKMTPAGAAPDALTFGQMLARAKVLATTAMVSKDLRDTPEGIVLVGAMGAELGVPFIASLAEIHVIDGKPSPSAQLRLALIRRAGHEAQFIESSAERAVIRGRRRERHNDPNGWTTVEWTIDQARQAGLLEQWVEQWKTSSGGKRYCEKFVLGCEGVAVPDWAQQEIRAGNVKSKDNWRKYPADMLRARAASALCRMEFSDVLLGMGVDEQTPEERGADIGQDLDDGPTDDDGGDIVDAVLVGEGSDQGPEDMEPDDLALWAEELTGRIDALPDDIKQHALGEWKSAGLPAPGALNEDQADTAEAIVAEAEASAAA